MTHGQSLFSRTNRRFENARQQKLIRKKIDFPLAEQVIRTSSRLFQMLDHDEPVQAEVSRRLWVLRSSILFTILPFDHPGLELTNRMIELEKISESLPEASQWVESLKRDVADLVSLARNPKRERLLQSLAEYAQRGDEPIGILSALSAGRAPGWPAAALSALSASKSQIVLIESRRQLISNVFESVVLPCACRNAPLQLLFDLLFSGRASTLEVLLYPGERFEMPRRLTLPNDKFFEGRLSKTQIEREVVVVPSEPAMHAVDDWINEAFWQGLHGASRTSLLDQVPANYILFCDGTGAFLPAGGRILTLPENGSVNSESDLCTVSIDDLCEGDLIVLRSGESGLLLDEASDRIMGQAGNDNLFEMATDWKEALDALLVTHSNKEVAQELQNRGAPTRATNIHLWIGPEVLGPGRECVFRELINLLAEKGKIQKTGAELASYVESCWYSLQELRGVRQKAGNMIRHDLFTALFSRYGGGSLPLTDRDSVHIEGDAGTELLILRVSSVDRTIAHISLSRLGQLDDLKGNKWLG
jgi:hypothetical protein